jgi:hypothetical protein
MNEGCSLAAVKHRDHVDLWSLSRRGVAALGAKDKVSGDAAANKAVLGPRLQLMAGAERDHLHSVVISPAGDMVAVSGGGADGGSRVASGGLRVWQLLHSDDGLKAVRVSLPDEVLRLTSGELGECQAMAFSKDGNCLAVTVVCGGQVDILLLEVTCASEDGATVGLRHKLNHSKALRTAGGGGSREKVSLSDQLSAAVEGLSFSADGRWLVASSCGHRVSVYEVDRLTMHWVIPLFSSPVSCVSFHPTSANSLLIALSGDNSFLIYDVQEKGLSRWSRENSATVPQWSESLNRASVGPIYNVAFDPSSVSSFVLYGQAYSVCVDLDDKIPSSAPAGGAASHGQMCVPVPIDSPLAEPGSQEQQQQQPVWGFPVNRRESKKRKQMERSENETAAALGNASASSSSGKQSKARKPSRNYKVIKMRSVVQLAMMGRQEMVSCDDSNACLQTTNNDSNS